MLSPGDPTPPLSPEDAYLELLLETLEGLELQARGQFLQRYLKAIAQLELTPEESLEYWERILTRRSELAQSLGKRVSLKTAMIDVLASSRHLRVPILMEYEDLKRLQFNAATDPLTGLYNRRLFEENCEKELNRARRYAHKIVLVMLDLHRFKEVNDRYGHLRGDQVLQAAASTLRKSLRTSDSAFRIGGDEFALLLPEADAEQALTLSRRVRANFQAELGAMHLGVTVDLDYGVAVYPEDGDQREVLVRAADERLYRLKLENRGGVPETTPGMRETPPREERAKEEVPRKEIPQVTPPPRERAPVPPREEPAHERPAPPAPRTGERRRWERVSLAGTHASAAYGTGAQTPARILDLGYGGVAIETPGSEELSEMFPAVLNVPILPPVRVSLKRIYVLRGAGGMNRIGCSFAT